MDGRHGSEEVRLLPQLKAGVYRVDGMAAAPRIQVGAAVLPWRPLQGAYVLLERGESPPWDLPEVPGIGGVWWGSAFQPDARFVAANNKMAMTDLNTDELQLTLCFLDDHPVSAAERLLPLLEKRWADARLVPLLAAPFHPVNDYEIDRHLP
jgi:hypothetical protein